MQESVRQRLREATRAVHERLHGHEGLAQAASGKIGEADYRSLLGRLLGFHRAFEAAFAADDASEVRSLGIPRRRRAPLIVEDLCALGVAEVDVDRLPVCPDAFRPGGRGTAVGALYVVEGSTLGGAQIAAALASAFPDARRFLLGHGRDRGSMWREFATTLDSLADDPAACKRAIASALRTFEAFERWMADWRTNADRLVTAKAD